MSIDFNVVLMKTDDQQPTVEQVAELIKHLQIGEKQVGVCAYDGPYSAIDDDSGDTWNADEGGGGGIITLEDLLANDNCTMHQSVTVKQALELFVQRMPWQACCLVAGFATPRTTQIMHSLMKIDRAISNGVEPNTPSICVGPCKELIHENDDKECHSGSAMVRFYSQGRVPNNPVDRYDEAVRADPEIRKLLTWLKEHWGGEWIVFSTYST